MGFLGGANFPEDPTDLGPLVPLPGGWKELLEYLAMVGFTQIEFAGYGQNAANPGGAAPARPRRRPTPRRRRTSRTHRTLRGFLDDNGLEAIGNHGFIPNTWPGPNSPGGGMSTADYDRFQTELEFASILGMPFMGTGNDPTSANNRNIEPWTIAGEKWDALNTLSLAWGIHLYPHNHSPAYNFLQDGPMVTVTEDRVTGAPIPRRPSFAGSRESGSCSTFSTSRTPTCASSRWTSIWAHVAQHQWRWRYDWEGNRVEDIFDPLAQVQAQTIRYPLYHAKDGDSTGAAARCRQRLHLIPFGDPRSDIDFETFFKEQGARGYHNPNYEQDNAPGGGRRPRPVPAVLGHQRPQHERTSRIVSTRSYPAVARGFVDPGVVAPDESTLAAAQPPPPGDQEAPVRKATVLVGLLGLIGSSLFAALSTAASAAPAEKYRIFVFTSGAPNFAKVAAVQAIRDLGMANGFGVQSNGDPASFTAENLARFRAVVFLDTTGSPLNAAQEAAFEDYFRNGGGFVGVGSAVETEPDWQFLTDVLGSRSASKLGAQTVTNKVADRVHDASKNLPEYWNLNDTYYNWTSNVRGLSHVLTTVSDAPFNKTGDGPTINALTGGTMGADHPVTWCKDYQGGRSYYTNHGASAAAWNDANLAKELLGAITWAAGQADPVYSDCGATVLANYQQSFVAAPPNLSEPIGFDVLPDGTGRVIQTDRRGGVRLHDPATNSTTVLATLPVYTANEDGGYGPELDNNFNTNKWVYLFYSPPTVKDVKLSTGEIVTQTTPAGSAPNTAASVTAWDPYVGYFQLSRFKFVEASGGTPAHLDLASEQEILRVSNNRGACCHVGGDIEFDSHNNLWLVTGDDTPSGGGNSGGFSPFNSQLTNENQTITVAGATSGTFTLTFDGQTTAPIPFPLVNADIEAALEALSNLDDVAVTGTTVRTVNFRGDKSEQGVIQMTGDPTGLIGTTPTVTIATTQEGGWFFAPHVDARRTAQNTAHLGGKVLRITVKEGDISPSEANNIDGAYTVPDGNLFEVGMPRTRPEIYAMGFRNPFRITLDKNDVAYVTDYSPDSQVPQIFRGPQGTGRVEIVREPANYGWPLCVKTDLPYYKWDFNTSTPLPSAAAPEPHECDNPSRGPQNTSRWVANGGPGGRARARVRAADHPARDLVLVPRQPGAAERPARHAVLRPVRARRAA